MYGDLLTSLTGVLRLDNVSNLIGSPVYGDVPYTSWGSMAQEVSNLIGSPVYGDCEMLQRSHQTHLAFPI